MLIILCIVVQFYILISQFMLIPLNLNNKNKIKKKKKVDFLS